MMLSFFAHFSAGKIEPGIPRLWSFILIVIFTDLFKSLSVSFI